MSILRGPHYQRRRSFLGGLTALGLSACSPARTDLRVRVGVEMFDGALKDSFERDSNLRVEMSLVESPAQLAERLLGTDRVDVSLLGDAWLTETYTSKLARVETSRLRNWEQLGQQWKQVTPYGVPFRWGVSEIAYYPKHVTPAITDWADLWRESLRGRITLPDDRREVFGIALKRLGYSYNSPDPRHHREAFTLLQKLQPLVLTYTSDSYLDILIVEDSWVAVGWSADLAQAQREDPGIQRVVPRGTSLWADLWVLPADGGRQVAAYRWIDHFLAPVNAAQVALQLSSRTPVPASEQLVPGLTEDPLLYPPASVLEHSELIRPLPGPVERLQADLWQTLRQG
ncbi:MAG: spermidine/putrescine ABC transporter substrate-binding protein [Gemmatimonadaceae bacterium]|nr:spermidine/putrescine ABC transporter substrate-binding protein [Gloeobacterales cyanobacterium ES-bin-141]